MFEPIRRPINRVDNLRYLNDTVTKLDNPLCRIFKKNKLEDTLIGTLTTTRSSSATYVDMYGVLKTAAIGVPRQGSNGWLSEGASTNLLTYSNDFSNNVWTKANLTVVGNATISPDGTLTADKLVSDNVQGVRIATLIVASVVSGTSYTASVYLKPAGFSYASIFLDSPHWSPIYAGATVTIDLTLATSDNDLIKVKKLNNGWIRVEITAQSLSTGVIGTLSIVPKSSPSDNVNSVQGDGVSGIYVWGAQLEALPFASTYIPTTNTPITRAADENSIQYNGNVPRGDQPFTIRFKGVINGYANFNRIFSTETAVHAKRLIAYMNSSGNILLNIGSDENQVATSAITFGEVFEYIVTSDGVNYTSYLNGNFQAESLVVNPPTELSNELRVLCGHLLTNNSYGSCLTFEVFNRRIIWT